MCPACLVLTASILSQNPAIEPDHAANPVYATLLGEGVTLDGREVRLPAPILRDGQPADAQRAALRALAGSDRAFDDLLRESVSTPHILRIRDEPARDGTIIRAADLWFVVYADFDAIDPDDAMRRLASGQTAEAGNMRFESRLLTADELKSRGLAEPSRADGRREWYSRLTGRLLDRIGVEVTDQGVATRSRESWVVASRTATGFDNRWWPIVRRGGRDEPGESHPYAGGASYAKISRLAKPPRALLVEAHFAFAEPRAWFEGAPILRSKLGLIAQDQVRRLRRELAKRE